MTLYVNDQRVDPRRIDEEIERLRGHYQRVFPDQPADDQQKQLAEWARENVIERVLIGQAAEADEEPLPKEAVDEALNKLMQQHGGREKFFEKFQLDESREDEVRADVERKLKLDRLLERVTADTEPPTEEEMRAYYEEHQENFSNPELVRASHIVKHMPPGTHPGAVRDEMDKTLERLNGGTPFETLAGESSDCPDRGGDLGYFARGQMVQEFEDVVFGMEKGQTSGVFMTPFGFHIARVTDRKPASPQPFDDVKARIEKELTEARRQRAVEEYVDKLKEKATIEERQED